MNQIEFSNYKNESNITNTANSTNELIQDPLSSTADEASAPGRPKVSPRVTEEILAERATIDNIDAAIVHMLAERFKCTQRVGKLKARLGLPASDPLREKKQVQRLEEIAHSSGLDPEFAVKFIKFVVDEVIHHHLEIAAEYNQQTKN